MRIEDPLLCPSAVQGCEINVFPTKRGELDLTIEQIGLNRLWMSRYELNLPQVNRIAVRPGRRSIGFLTREGPSIQHCGMDVTPGDIVIDTYDVSHQRCGTNHRYGGMSLSEDDMNETLASIIGADFPAKLATRVVRPRPELMSRLLMMHQTVGELARTTPDALETPELRRGFEQQMSYLMVRCLAEGAGIEITAGRRRHDAIIARLEDYLAENSDRAIYLTELCAATGVSERTLRSACEEHLGMAPIRYLTLRRMYLVRRALLRADASKATVTHIVTNYGFWELGRFSVAYRTMFGELPSETLRRPPQDPHVHLMRPTTLPVEVIVGRLH
ncbi:helix-turn-helix domain-containing protein [Bradyrhizobium sp. AS23.2]|uniref:AraC family transcriptional regulator n=1 Tax=Bradyrhizobium sp. AS23.2 TaxID=1680155 RepID=UPI000939089C|nr:helix-turn-helix domain-containing protein [Bradyrhizobium sp. AS23.2]